MLRGMFLSSVLRALHTSVRLVKHALVRNVSECSSWKRIPRCARSHRRGCAHAHSERFATLPCELTFPCADCCSNAAKLIAGDSTGCAAVHGELNYARSRALWSSVAHFSSNRAFSESPLVGKGCAVGRGRHRLIPPPPSPVRRVCECVLDALSTSCSCFSATRAKLTCRERGQRFQHPGQQPGPLTARVRLQPSDTDSA
ncbi:hypothetical protein SRHO_G00317470 [Serrasalmus rhombeus]